MTTETTPTAERPQPTVTDRHGKVWPFSFTVNLIKPLAAVFGHPPRDILTDPEKLVGFLADPEKVAAAAYVLLERPKPATFAGKAVELAAFASAEEFTAALDAEALDQTAEAVVRLVAGMFAPRGKAEQVADALIGLLKEAGAKAADAPPEPTEQPAATAAA